MSAAGESRHAAAKLDGIGCCALVFVNRNRQCRDRLVGEPAKREDSANPNRGAKANIAEIFAVDLENFAASKDFCQTSVHGEPECPVSLWEDNRERLKRQVVGQQSEIPRIRSLHESEQNQFVSCEAIHITASQCRKPCLTIAKLDQCSIKPPSFELIANCLHVRRAGYAAF